MRSNSCKDNEFKKLIGWSPGSRGERDGMNLHWEAEALCAILRIWFLP